MDLPSAIFSAACRWQMLFELTWLVQGLTPGGIDPAFVQRQILEPANRRVAAIERLSAAGLNIDTDSPLYHGPDWLFDLALGLPYDYIAPGLTVREVAGYNRKANDPAIDMGQLAAFPELGTLALPEHQVTTADMAIIGRLKNLGYLVVGKTTDEGLAQLAGHGALGCLCFDASEVSDQGLDALGTLPELIDLNMQGGKFSGQGFARLKKLRRLHLDRCTIPADLVAQLGTNATIDELRLSDMFIRSLDGLENLRELWKLDLTFSNLDDEMLKHIGRLEKLHELRLDCTEVGDKAAAYISQATHLEKLGLGCTQVSDSGVKSFRSLRDLKTLLLNHTGVTDDGILALEDLPKLSTLVVSRTTVDEETVRRVVKQTGDQEFFLLVYGFPNGMNFGR
jgi:hypothetical protein